MGPLYEPGWEAPVELLEGVPVREAAARVAQIMPHTEPRGN
jgi:hypothetical protein